MMKLESENNVPLNYPTCICSFSSSLGTCKLLRQQDEQQLLDFQSMVDIAVKAFHSTKLCEAITLCSAMHPCPPAQWELQSLLPSNQLWSPETVRL